MDLEQLRQEQIAIGRKVVLKDDFTSIGTIGAVDQAFYSNKIVSCAVVCDRKLAILEKKGAIDIVKMPYLPNFLYFREGHVAMQAVQNLEKKPDILIVDGDGILHPLGAGMASHMGVLLDIPTIGVARSLCYGTVEEDRVIINNAVVGMELRTREYAKPLYISPGHRISLDTAVALIKELIRYPHKLPEPLHIAHREAERTKDGLMKHAREIGPA